jgi:hypothetical protein
MGRAGLRGREIVNNRHCGRADASRFLSEALRFRPVGTMQRTVMPPDTMRCDGVLACHLALRPRGVALYKFLVLGGTRHESPGLGLRPDDRACPTAFTG